MSPYDLIGTASYVDGGVLSGDQHLLAALLAIVARRRPSIQRCPAEAVYFYLVGSQQLWVGILWAGIFNLINIVQLTRLTRARLKVRMSAEERALHASIFGRLEPVEFSRILAAGRITAPDEGVVLRVRTGD